MKIYVDKNNLESFVVGGAILGGGGGGWPEEGKILADEAIKRGFKEIWPIELLDSASLLLTVSAVGAPSVGHSQLQPEDYARAVELFLEKSRVKISGLISSEIGAMAIVNGWIQSALLGIPVIDAPADGRAHPLGLMGSMGLHKSKNYVSLQAAVSRNQQGKRIEQFFIGPLEETARAVRSMAAELGNLVAVARNPVEAGYVKLKGAPGAIYQAFYLGEIFLKANLKPEKKIRSLLDYFGCGQFILGKIIKLSLHQKKGFDLGLVEIISKGEKYELTFWNEYMTLEKNGQRLATFPDLIMTFDATTASPLISAALKESQEIYLIAVPSQKLILGDGVKDPELLQKAEQAIGKRMINKD